MNTCSRRFFLRLAIGLLTFLLGVAAVWALSGFNPFQSSSSERQYRQKRYEYNQRRYEYREDTRDLEPTYLVGPHGCKAKRFQEPPPPPGR